MVVIKPDGWKFNYGDAVKKKTRGGKGVEWRGHVVGFYTSSKTTEGYAIESSFEEGSIQIYPASMIESWKLDE